MAYADEAVDIAKDVGKEIVNDSVDYITNGAGQVVKGFENLPESTRYLLKNTGSFVLNGFKSYTARISNDIDDLKQDTSALVDTVVSTPDRLRGDTITSSAEQSSVPEEKFWIPTLGAFGSGSLSGYGEGLTPLQKSPVLSTYSPRLFGAPPQLTTLNDIRYMTADIQGGVMEKPGQVGDFYFSKILNDAQVANFIVGKALFTGGMASPASIITMIIKYTVALRRYDIFGGSGSGVKSANTSSMLDDAALKSAYENAISLEDDNFKVTTSIWDSDDDEYAVQDLTSHPEIVQYIAELANVVDGSGGDVKSFSDKTATMLAGVASSLLHSLSVQQPFYTFESDWHSYIQNVKMMINTAVIQLGLQSACVRIGDEMVPIGMSFNNNTLDEPWSLYSSWINTPRTLLNSGSVQGFDTITGDTAQYVSFMIDPAGSTESFTNTVGDSQIYAQVINQGSELGTEIAFLTNSSKNSVDDAIINIAGGAVNAAESVLTAMTAGVGRFTAAVAGSFARSFVGNHTIYPQIFKEHTSTQTREITIHLNASGGDPYSYLTDILVPYFFILGMVLPALSKNNASAYSFPPLVQCNIPGIWGTRLGMVTAVSVNKNSSGKDLSINGYPLSIDITMTVTDLQHVLLTSPQDRTSIFLNNHTMFDYIAVCAGVDKYRPNGAIRLVSRLALAANNVKNIKSVFGEAVLSDFTSFVNRTMGVFNI